jgi:hypothetical protein
LSARLANTDEVESVAVFERHMKDIAPERYVYSPYLLHIFSRNDDGKWVFHKGMFYLWFKKNVDLFSKLSGVPAEFTRAVESYQNMNSYLLKHKEMVESRSDTGMTTDDIVKESDMLWAEYKAVQLDLLSP